jgi:hypothetical protein
MSTYLSFTSRISPLKIGKLYGQGLRIKKETDSGYGHCTNSNGKRSLMIHKNPLSSVMEIVASISQNLLQVVYEQHVEIIMIHIFLLNCNKCTDHYDMVPNMAGLYIWFSHENTNRRK